MTDLNPTPLDAFPVRQPGQDELRFTIVAFRPADTESPTGNVGLDLVATGMPGAVIDALAQLGCAAEDVFVQASIIDEGHAPIIRLVEAVVPAAEDPEDPPSEG